MNPSLTLWENQALSETITMELDNAISDYDTDFEKSLIRLDKALDKSNFKENDLCIALQLSEEQANHFADTHIEISDQYEKLAEKLLKTLEDNQ